MDTISSATSENIKIFLVGNKSDLLNENEDNRKVSREMARMYVDRYQNVLKNMECSAKYKSNLIEPFEELCKGCILYLIFFNLLFIIFIEIYIKQKDSIKEKNEMRKKLLKSKIEKKKFYCC